MTERNTAGDEPPGTEPSAAPRAERTRRRHLIYYMTERTNQIVKLEEYDEETGATRELPLAEGPQGHLRESSTSEFEESHYSYGQNPYAYSWPGSYGGSPQGLLLWIAPAPAPFESPYWSREAAVGFPPPCRRQRAVEGEIGIGPPKAGGRRFPDLGMSIPPPKAGRSRFEDFSIDPPKAGRLSFEDVGIGPPKAGAKSISAPGPPKAGSETFASEGAIGPPKAGTESFTPSPGIGPPKAGNETAGGVTPIGPPKAGPSEALDEAPLRPRRRGREGGGRVSPTRSKSKA